MWARYVEMALGVWLLVSPWVLPDAGGGVTVVNMLAGALVLLLAGLSFTHRLRAAHLGSLLVSIILIGWGWSHFVRPGPAAAQNQILTGLMLGLVTVVPSESFRPPPCWRAYVSEEKQGEA